MTTLAGELKSRCEVTRTSHDTIDVIIRERHYLKKWPAIVMARYALWMDCLVMGACVFSLPPRETDIRYGGKTFELSRLWCDDALPRNTESWFIARCIALIKHDAPSVKFLVSYADPSQGHNGTIYLAANWIFDGKTDSDRKTPRFDYVANGKRYQRRSHVPEGDDVQRIARISKNRFVYPIQNRRYGRTYTP
jgi:hypothetical protein